MRKPENFFVVILLIFGILLVFITPIGGGADEDTHVGRVWEMSKGALIPNQYMSTGPYYPFVFYTLSFRQDLNLTPVSWEAFKTKLMTRIDWDNMIHHNVRARYFPTLYLPQAFIMGIMGRVFDVPVGIIYYTERLSYLMLYALTVYLAIRIVPVGKWIMGVIAIMPMALIQAASISPDGLNNGISFIFIAWVFYLNSPEKRTTFSRKDWWITALLVLLICTLKLNTLPILLMLFLIPRVKFGNLKWLVGFIGITLASIIIISLGWNYLTSSFLLDATTADHYSVSDQIKGIFAEPGRFVSAMIDTIWMQTPGYIHDWIGISGYDYWDLPAPVYWFTPILLLLAVLGEKSQSFLNPGKRILALGIFVVVFLSTMVMFYLIYNPPGTLLIPGVQGRYFTFIGPLVFIALTPVRSILNLNKIWIQIGSVLVLLICVVGLFLAYHVTCGSTFYTPGLCNLPRVKNWSPETSLSLVVNDNRTGAQSFYARCDNLAQVRIWIKSKGTSSDALPVQVVEAGTNTVIHTGLISQKDIPPSGWLDIPMPVVATSKDKTYLLTVGIPGKTGNPNIELAYTTRNEYMEGDFSVNKEKQTGDLLFLYNCSTGLSQLFSPAKP